MAEALNVEGEIDIVVGTLSKAVGCQGGFVACRCVLAFYCLYIKIWLIAYDRWDFTCIRTMFKPKTKGKALESCNMQSLCNMGVLSQT